MTAILVRVSEAIRKELESISLSQKVECLQRSYGDWEDLLEDNERGLRIDVVPNSCLPATIGEARILANRGGRLIYECNVSILLRRRFLANEHKNGRVDVGLIDQLVEDLQTVSQFFSPKQPNFQARKLADVQEAAWSPESGIKAPYSRKLLKDPGQYSGWCSVIYNAYVDAR